MALGRRIGLAALVATLGLVLCGFRPFTPVQSVCPKCPVSGDKVSLKNGKVVIAKVVGKNQDGYILERYGELRFSQFREIKKIDFKSGAECLRLVGRCCGRVVALPTPGSVNLLLRALHRNKFFDLEESVPSIRSCCATSSRRSCMVR